MKEERITVVEFESEISDVKELYLVMISLISLYFKCFYTNSKSIIGRPGQPLGWSRGPGTWLTVTRKARMLVPYRSSHHWSMSLWSSLMRWKLGYLSLSIRWLLEWLNCWKCLRTKGCCSWTGRAVRGNLCTCSRRTESWVSSQQFGRSITDPQYWKNHRGTKRNR
jgi:hypothetical protein